LADPQTVNVGLAVPLRGSNPGTWDTPVNADFSAIDGMFAGVANVALSNVPVTLTAPAGFTPTPGPGPVQSQNAVIQFSGALSANVTVTLPTPGYMVLENITTGAFLVIFRAVGSGEVISTPQGSRVRVYCDGTNVRFVEGIEGRPGKMEFEGGETGLPAWVAACTKRPYLLADGTATYLVADYPALGAKYGNKFGGNGITTFGVPDMQGRVPLAYDGTGTRITVAGCGIDGQTIGAAGGLQTMAAMVRSDLPNQVVTVNIVDPGHFHTYTLTNLSSSDNGGPAIASASSQTNTNTGSKTTGITANLNLNGGVTQTLPANVQPSIVAGVWLIKT